MFMEPFATNVLPMTVCMERFQYVLPAQHPMHLVQVPSDRPGSVQGNTLLNRHLYHDANSVRVRRLDWREGPPTPGQQNSSSNGPPSQQPVLTSLHSSTTQTFFILLAGVDSDSGPGCDGSQ